MAYRFDPRGDLSAPLIQPSSYFTPWNSTPRSRDFAERRQNRRTTHYSQQISQPKRRPCFDWIISSASNVHVAINRSTFRTYTPFSSYVLAVSDQRKIIAHGVGTVELKIRRQPGHKESQIITLENVLHVPGWLCNIFSDVHFRPVTDYEHTWTDFGVSFLKKENGKWRDWGFTENFCGLDKLVLATSSRGRSPMLEDRDREVFSVNITWPQGQRDKWEALVSAAEKREEHRQELKFRREKQSGLTEMTGLSRGFSGGSLELRSEPRSGLTEVSANSHKRTPSARASSLKAQTSN